MTLDGLKQTAMQCLAKALKGDSSIPSHVVQAAVSILLTPEKLTGE